MIIFIRNIPEDTSKKDIIAFIQPTLKGGFFKKSGKIHDIKHLRIKVIDISWIEYHALVQIEPEAAALRVIKKLHGKKFNGRHTAVRQYHVRRWQNDRRLTSSKDVPPGIKEKRITSTRRRNVEITVINTVEFTGYKELSRKY